MSILTYTVAVGGAGCNAKCPWCVSKQTPGHSQAPINERYLRSLDKGAQLAVREGATTLLLTGKGEPTLYPKAIHAVLSRVGSLFPIIEIQTNGLEFEDNIEPYLEAWYELGITTVAISIAHHTDVRNELLIGGASRGCDLEEAIKAIHEAKMMVRLSVVMVQGGIDCIGAFEGLHEFCRLNGVDQLSLRPAVEYVDDEVRMFKEGLRYNKEYLADLEFYLDRNGTKTKTMPYGATVYDLQGQNVCLTNCLTPPTGDVLRQLIHTSDGVFDDWRYKSSIRFR